MPATKPRQQNWGGRSKRGKKRPRPPSSDEYVKVVPLRIEDDQSASVQISKARRGKNSKVSPDNLTFSSSAGYRSVQSNRGTFCGTWYFEIHVKHLGPTGHARLGIGTVKHDVNAPCGHSEASFGYRDVDGSKITAGFREKYAEPYKEGDIIGVYLHLPEGGHPNEPKTEIVRWKGKLFQTDDAPIEPPKPLVGSMLGFSVNGKWQGVAFRDLLQGTYYAAASLFTKPRPDKLASVEFNFGPTFRHSPPEQPDLPPATPFCLVPPKPRPLPDADGQMTVDRAIQAIVRPAEDQDNHSLAQTQAPPKAPPAAPPVTAPHTTATTPPVSAPPFAAPAAAVPGTAAPAAPSPAAAGSHLYATPARVDPQAAQAAAPVPGAAARLGYPQMSDL